MTPADERFMARTFDLATQAGFTSPNPRVGALVVRDGTVIGEGFHRGAGRPHAEAEALSGIDAAGATLYVNLEPCSHTGAMPPCAPAIVEAGIVRVVVAIEDPDPRVSGRGLAYLRDNGVEVTPGVLAHDASLLNAPFLHRVRTGRPLLSLKLASSLDGRLAAADGSARWITGATTRRYVHQRRAGADAVMVGVGTVREDDPSLTVRDAPTDHQPVKVIVDGRGTVEPDASALVGGSVLFATTDACSHERQTAYKEAGAEVVVLAGDKGRVHLPALLDDFASRGWTEVLCEGGARLATSLLAGDHVDLIEMHFGPVMLGAGPAVGDLGVRTMSEARRFSMKTVRQSGDDVIVIMQREEG